MKERTFSTELLHRRYQMTDVVCFCGCCYSFDGEVGVCPLCGEYVGLTGVSVPEVTVLRARYVSLEHAIDPDMD
jgi:hypothetical protein